MSTPLSAETIVRAQHEETGRMWEGPRSQLPPRFVEVGSSKTSLADLAHEVWQRACAIDGLDDGSWTDL